MGKASTNRKKMARDLQKNLPHILSKAIGWAEDCADEAAVKGSALSERGIEIDRAVSVQSPERIRILIVDSLPKPDDALLLMEALQTDLLGPKMCGLTFGHSIFVCRGHETVQLFSHEFRHVYQYEKFGSIAAFLSIYLPQIFEFGYNNAPLEIDARAHERQEV